MVAGSGAAGMTAALTAAHFGLSALVIEKAGSFGGSTARSGGVMWIPNNPFMKRDGIVSGVLEHEDAFRTTLEQLLDLPIVGDIRGAGYFYGIEMVKDKATRETFSDDESERLLRGFLSQALFDAGLVCRADDRGDPVIQLAPPLITTAEQFGEIHDVLRPVLEEASSRLGLS